MTIEETGIINIPTDPDDLRKIGAVIKDICDQKLKIDAMSDYIKEAKKSLKEDWDLPASAISRLIKLYYDQSADEYFESQRELENLYDSLFTKKVAE